MEKILDIKVNYNEAVKAIAEYQTKIDAARDAEKNLKKQLRMGKYPVSSITRRLLRQRLPLQIIMMRYVSSTRQYRIRLSRRKSRRGA